ncbi:MAG TPA: dynamin family protein [Pseudonocardia sp.]|nr:dynamin family protein [Pseudonocardia sp.]
MPAAIEVIDQALRAVTAYGRPDLAGRLHRTRRRLEDPDVRVLVVGEFKQGKSHLVNSLVTAPVCPVDDDIATAVPTVVRHGDPARVTLVRESASEDGSPPRVQRTEIPAAQLADYVCESADPQRRRGVTYVEVSLPRTLLADGLVLVDTPGVGGLGSSHGAATMAALTGADAVLLVSDAAQEYTGPELEFLAAAMELCPNLTCVVTKTDLYPHWREIVELDRGHLAAAGVAADLIGVSSALRTHALRTRDRELNEESGYPALIAHLRRRVLGEAEQLDRRAVRQDVLAVCEQLRGTMEAELAAQENPERTAELVAELQEAKARAATLKSRGSRWQITLNDGVADLQSDIDFDLRDRIRRIAKESDALADSFDPIEAWDQYAAWVQKQIAAAASANFVWATERARHLAAQVAEHFVDERGGAVSAVPDLPETGVDGLVGRVVELERPDAETFGASAKALSGLRGGYMGALMFGLMTSLAGMALINPLSVGAGVALGAKTLRDDKRGALQRRQAQGKAAVRAHLDDVQFQIGKDSRDMLRRMQRTVRDHFSAVAEELHTSITESVAAAQRAVRTSEAERDRRVADLRAELARVDALAAMARGLVAG